MSQEHGASPTLDKTFVPAEVETRHAKRWEESGAFGCGRGAGAPYSIVIPPPNVTGSLHMGHALNNTLQDILVRWRRMQGRDVLWQPGTDHAGIATQMVVERQLDTQGIGLDRGVPSAGNRKLISRDEFVRRVWQWKVESGGTISRQLRRLGASLDWGRERFTMDAGLSAAVQKVFVDLYKRGLIYRDNRLVNWDPKLHTAISDLEVEQREIKGHLWHFKYPIEGAPGEFIVVATTRPETMLGDTGVAVHPGDARYTRLVGRHCVLPLVGRRLPIVADEYSDPEKGTGAVKITPAHDFNDFEVARRHELAMINIFTADAKLNDQVPEPFRGLDRFEARKRVVAAMEAEGRLEKVEAHTHVVPHGDRSGVPVEPWLTMQWYVDAATLAKPAIEAVEQGRTVFVPKNWEKTYFEWMRNIQPWSISRQLWWGHQIPAWYGPDGQVFVEMDETAARAAARDHYGKDTPLTRDPDVLDTWFSSALWPFSTLGWPDRTPELARYYPTSVLVTGFDIIFFWVARMMMMGLHFMGEIPFHIVYIHALVRDAKGQKMSKSKGNIIDPLDLIDRYGCDALRFTLTALAAQGRDIKLAESRVEGYRNFATKLWNAARYCQMSQSLPRKGFDPRAARLTVNRWIIGELARAASETDAALEAFRFNDAANALYRFTWGTFCDWYLEFTKPVMSGADEVAKTETRAVTGYVLEALLRLLHPVMPFITEELWEKLALDQDGMLIVAPWPDLSPDLVDPTAKAEMDWVVELLTSIRSIRSEYQIPWQFELPLGAVDASQETQALLLHYEDLLVRMGRIAVVDPNVKSIAKPLVRQGHLQFVVGDATYTLDVAGRVDVKSQAQRIGRELKKLADEIEMIDRKLENPAFLAKADPAVVEDQRERRSEAEAARNRLAIALERVQAI